MSNDAMTASDQVAMHEQVEDARRVLLSRNTEESYAMAAVLSHLRGSINARLRDGQSPGLAPHALRRACLAILTTAAAEEVGEVTAAMTAQEAATLLLAVEVPQPVAQAIGVVLDRLAELEGGEVTTEWGIRWPEVDEVEQEKGSEVYARGVAQLYPGEATLMAREARRGPWTPVVTP